MERMLMEQLLKWKNNPQRKPIILKGVRQCGKTYLLREFGNTCYEDVAYYNFAGDDTAEKFFTPNPNPQRIIKTMSLARNKDIKPRKTLIILDEIQFCPPALAALKHFRGEAPEYHVAAAGSFWDIYVDPQQEKTALPPGMVSYMTLYPLNFYEFLLAQDKPLARNLKKTPINDGRFASWAPGLKEKLLEFLVVGGMPKAVKTWVETGSIEQTEEAQQEILDGCEVDFVKYAPLKHFPKLSAIWSSIPGQLAKENRKFVFNRVKQSWRAADLQYALEWLVKAGLVYKVEQAEKPVIPLAASGNSNYFKLYMCDTGLLRKMLKLSPGAVFDKGAAYLGLKEALAENYALCELMNVYGETPYFWCSGGSGKAAVDFLIREGGDIVPIEVKAGPAGHSQALTHYSNKFQPRKEILVSPESDKPNIMPLHLICKIKEWLE